MKRFFYFIKTTCVVFVLVAAWSVHAIDYLFVAYDMGDFNPIRRVASQLPEGSYEIVAFGQAGKTAGKENLPHMLIIDGDFSSRETLFTETQLAQILQDPPKVIFTGMASAAQAQVLNASPLNKDHKLAFYDNFDAPKEKEYIQPFLKTIKSQSVTYLVSATFLKPAFVEVEKLGTHDKITAPEDVKVVGQPVLGDWKVLFDKKNADERKKLRAQLNVKPDQKVIVWATDTVERHKDHLTIFTEALKQNPTWKGIITLHPKLTVEEIQKIVEGIGADNVTIVPKDGPPTTQVASIASVFALHQSSVGPQAFYANVPVVYVAPSSYTNFMMEQGLAPRFDTVAALSDYLKAFQPVPTTDNTQQMKEVGIPVDGPKDICKILEQTLALK